MFVDIHSHVLYGLDDGARTVEESVAMLQMAIATGTRDIVATPHANGRYRFKPDLIADQIAQLSALVPGIGIHCGCDFHLQIDNIEDALAHPAKYSINHQTYLMVEFPELSVFADPEGVLLRLIDGGLVPVITHPERNVRLQRRFDDLARWVECGCLVQVTAGSCTGTFGKSVQTATTELLTRGLVHFVASDAHDCARRSPNLADAYDALSAAWGEEVVRPLFVDHPRAVLTGEPIDITHAPRPVKRRKWYQVWV